tara:strand:- start:493 stop:771 length:279 start_codon:yes stop_codon:yes gene_type:complete
MIDIHIINPKLIIIKYSYNKKNIDLLRSKIFMSFRTAKLRVKELANALELDSPKIIATCTLLKIPASSSLSILSVDQCKEIIEYLKKEEPLL